MSQIDKIPYHKGECYSIRLKDREKETTAANLANVDSDLITWINSRSKRTTNGCLEFQGRVNDRGYGRMKLSGRGKSYMVHRVVYVLTYGPLPPGKFALHTCDNPPCVEPTHLYAGTKSDNMKDMWERNPPKSRR